MHRPIRTLALALPSAFALLLTGSVLAAADGHLLKRQCSTQVWRMTIKEV